MLPGGDNLPVSDLLRDGADLGADLRGCHAGPSRGAGGNVGTLHSRLVLSGARVGRKPAERKSYRVVWASRPGAEIHG